jgi:signal transduction histidine kinase
MSAAPALRARRSLFSVEGRDYWIYQFSGWGTLTVVSILTSAGGSWQSAVSFAYAKSLCMLAAFGMSHLWRGYLKRHGWLHRNEAFPFRFILAGVALISVVQTGVLFATDYIFRNSSLLEVPEEVPLMIGGIFLLWFAVFSFWTLWYAMVLSRRRAVAFELEKLELELSMKDAELRALQAQVNPHFFFNSLNSIRALIYQDADGAAQAVGQLAGMMRHSLHACQADTVSLHEELAAVSAYLAMEKLRFDERLQLSMDIESGLDAVRLPPMMLQTLVENAIKHGVEHSVGPCQVRIEGRRHKGRVEIRVRNQGKLTSNSSSTRLGLANVGKRLALLFGPWASCTLAEENGWVVATVQLPGVLA